MNLRVSAVIKKQFAPVLLTVIQRHEPIFRGGEPKIKKQSILPTYSVEISDDSSINEDLLILVAIKLQVQAMLAGCRMQHSLLKLHWVKTCLTLGE